MVPRSMPLWVPTLVLIAVASAGLLLLIRATEVPWWAIDLAGVLSFALIAAAATLKPGSGTHPVSRFRLHVRLGRWAAVLALLHAAVIPIVDTTIWLDATVSMPVYLIAGLIALPVLLATALVREPIFPIMRFSPAGRRLHRAGAILSLLTVAAHIAFIPGLGLVRTAGIVGAAALVAALLLWPDAVALAQRSWMALAGIVLTAAALVLAGSWLSEARMKSFRAAPADHRIFDHESHRSVTCTTCHHNFLDKSGMENCLSCHKARSTTEFNRIDRVFHAFCRDCHAERRLVFERAGPIQSCTACHAKHRP
jgi:predicted CXXCH cytochrome family protein